MEHIKPLREVRREHIRRVLESTEGDIQEASRILGVTPRALQQLVREHGLSPQEAQERSPLTPTEE
jgi:DNA-binding NtrC family response regulator